MQSFDIPSAEALPDISDLMQSLIEYSKPDHNGPQVSIIWNYWPLTWVFPFYVRWFLNMFFLIP